MNGIDCTDNQIYGYKILNNRLQRILRFISIIIGINFMNKQSSNQLKLLG